MTTCPSSFYLFFFHFPLSIPRLHNFTLSFRTVHSPVVPMMANNSMIVLRTLPNQDLYTSCSFIGLRASAFAIHFDSSFSLSIIVIFPSRNRPRISPYTHLPIVLATCFLICSSYRIVIRIITVIVIDDVHSLILCEGEGFRCPNTAASPAGRSWRVSHRPRAEVS